VGFVRFEQGRDASEAIRALNGNVPPGGTEILVVRVCG
jgi:hypothetical protein